MKFKCKSDWIINKTETEFHKATFEFLEPQERLMVRMVSDSAILDGS